MNFYLGPSSSSSVTFLAHMGPSPLPEFYLLEVKNKYLHRTMNLGSYSFFILTEIQNESHHILFTQQ